MEREPARIGILSIKKAMAAMGKHVYHQKLGYESSNGDIDQQTRVAKITGNYGEVTIQIEDFSAFLSPLRSLCSLPASK